MTSEERRLEASRERREHWKRWGPYLSERAWGTVREDYSEYGTAWEFLPHDHARSHAYRWNEDGIAGICDRHQKICFAIALWNGKESMLKERLFGLTGNEGNHGKDVKECYYYLDSTPTHSYMKCLYKYPHAAFPYRLLVEENRRRGRGDREFELLDTGVFGQGRYFDVFVEYAKAAVEDILIRITVHNRGPEPATLDVLPAVWFRNTWSWGRGNTKPLLKRCGSGGAVIEIFEPQHGQRWIVFEGSPQLLFTENETNTRRLFSYDNGAAHTKDAINDSIVHGAPGAVSPAQTGTKASAHYEVRLAAGGSASIKARLTNTASSPGVFGPDFDEVFADRQREADEFYATLIPSHLSADAQNVMRQSLAIQNRPDLTKNIACMETKGQGERRLLSIVDAGQLRRVLRFVLDESEFLSPYGIRALSRHYKDNPYVLSVDGSEHRVSYEPAESITGVFGGNSNWRGPIWFPLNLLLIESLQKFYHYYGPGLTVECPTGSGASHTLWEVAAEVSRRLAHIFLKGPDGRRPVNGSNSIYAGDPHWRDLILFYECFHGDDGSGLGASHQTGWTGLVAKLLQQNGE